MTAYARLLAVRCAIAACLLLMVAPVCRGADAVPGQGSRPRIGLVLSGGGARGAAHVGVLEVLEELHVPVDIVVGTSMGAIVGGIYSTGAEPREIAKLTSQISWKEIFTEKVPRDKQFYRQKDDRGNYLATIRVDAQKGLVIPQGIVSGKKLELVLRALTLGAGEDYSSFPVPFCAVASDIETGEMVTLAKGDLAKSLNASMAIPGIFSPVEIDGRLLVDGGVARNLPVDVARQMGADVVIAVNIGTPLYKRDKLGSFLSISDQTTSFLTTRNVEEQIRTLKPGDVLITPDMQDVTTMSFTMLDKAIQIGRDAALGSAPELSRYALSEEEYLALRKEQLKKSCRLHSIDFVDVKQKEILKSGIVSGYLKERIEKAKGAPPQTEELSQAIFEVSDRADLENIDFSLVEKDGKQGLLISAKAREHMQHNIKVGFQMSDNLQGDNSYDVLLKYTLSRINSLGAEWKNKFRFGERRGVFTEFYQPLDSSAWRVFAAPYFEYVAIPFYMYDDASKIAEYQQRDLSTGADLGIQLAEYGEARLGFLKGTTDISLETGEPSLPEAHYHNGALKASLVIDTLDNQGFPSRGTLLRTTFLAQRTVLGSYANINMISALAAKPFSWGRNTLIFRARFDSVFHHTDDVQHYFFAGGFLDMSGLAPAQLYGQQIAMGECIYTYKLLKEQVFGNDLYAGLSFEMGNAWDDRSDMSIRNMLRSGSIFIGADSIIGPIYLAYGHAEGGHDALYFIVGYSY